MARNEVVILVPGFLGFGTFGDTDGPHIAYFERVAHVLQEATGWNEKQFYALEPPPTGPLWTRVECLYRKVRDLQEKFDRVHLVGHSTGGVDARLLVNEKYLWPGGPSQRQDLIDRLGHVISISAPFRGTPFADRLPIGLELTVPAATALSIATTPSLIRGPSQFWNAFSALLPDDWLPRDADAPELVALADPKVWPEIHRFLKRLVADRRLIGDLATQAMKKLNKEIAGGETHAIESFVTVAPRPTLLPTWHPGRATLRYFYALTYWFAHPSSDSKLDVAIEHISTPPGVMRVASPQARKPLGSNDGVVPVGSQTLHGKAAGIVVADHLDVIGHFPSGINEVGQKEPGGGITFFDSEAHFRDDEFKQFWWRVGKLLLTEVPKVES